jgi:hypothetical protein
MHHVEYALTLSIRSFCVPVRPTYFHFFSSFLPFTFVSIQFQKKHFPKTFFRQFVFFIKRRLFFWPVFFFPKTSYDYNFLAQIKKSFTYINCNKQYNVNCLPLINVSPFHSSFCLFVFLSARELCQRKIFDEIFTSYPKSSATFGNWSQGRISKDQNFQNILQKIEIDILQKIEKFLRL